MAKGRKPTTAPSPIGTPKTKAPPPASLFVTPAARRAGTAREVTLTAPLSTGKISESGYISDRLDLHFNTRVQRENVKRLYLALNARGERIPNTIDPSKPGRFVQSTADAVRWLFEKMGTAGE